MPDPRRTAAAQAVGVWVEELQATPALLTGWAAAFDDTDDMTLVVLAPADDAGAFA